MDKYQEIYTQEHFGVLAPLLLDGESESILVRGLEQIIVRKSSEYAEAKQEMQGDYQLAEIINGIERFAILTGKDDFLSTYLLPGGVICQIMHKFRNNPHPLLLFELPLLGNSIWENTLHEYVGEDAARFLKTAITAGLSLIVCGDRGKGSILSGLTHGLNDDCTLVNIECGQEILTHVERTFTVNYITSSVWAKMIGSDQIIPHALTYRPQCILIGDVGDINLSAIFTQYSGQLLAGVDSSSLDDALKKVNSLIPYWFQQLSSEEAVKRFAGRIPLFLYTSRSRDGTPIIQSINETIFSKETLSSKVIYRRDPSNLQSAMLRINTDAKVGKYLASLELTDHEWKRTWGVSEKPQTHSNAGILGALRKLLIRWE